MGIAYASDKPMSSHTLNTPFAPGKALYRTNFPTSAADIVGINTLDGPGLTVGTWEGTANSVFVADGELRPRVPGVTGAVGLPLHGVGAHVSMIVRQPPTTGASNIYLDMFRPAINLSQTNAYRLCIYPGNQASILVRTDSGVGTRITPIFEFEPGARVGLRAVGGVLSLLIDRVPMIHVKNSQLSTVNGNFVVANFAGATGWSLDSLEIDVY